MPDNTPDDIVAFKPERPHGTVISNGPVCFEQNGRKYARNHSPLDALGNALEGAVTPPRKPAPPEPEASPTVAESSAPGAPYDLTLVHLRETSIQPLRMLWASFFPGDEFPGKAAAVAALHEKQAEQEEEKQRLAEAAG